MIKTSYRDEINLPQVLRPGARGPYVRRVQEWLNLKRFTDSRWSYRVDIDSEYGPLTEKVVRFFQEANGLVSDGIVGQNTFAALTKPMLNAFSRLQASDTTTIRDLVVAYAEQHLVNHPMELNNANRGPWVRAYMDGNEGAQWPWCLGFVQTIIDQAYSTHDRSFLEVMPRTVGCDVLGDYGKLNNRLIPNSDLRTQPDKARRGDVFLLAHQGYGWAHTGIVTEVDGFHLHTIEGNTSHITGSAEGYEVCKRIRDVKDSKIDIYSIQD